MPKLTLMLFFITIMILSCGYGVAYAQPYSPGETLNPTCAPGTADCSVITAPRVYPGAGLAISNGSAWGTSLTAVDGRLLIGSSGAWAASPFTIALPGPAGAVLFSDGTNWTLNDAPAISAANMTSFPTFNQNTTGTSAGITGKTFIGTATQIPLLAGTPAGSKCIHTDANGNLTEASADCGGSFSGAAGDVTYTQGGTGSVTRTVATKLQETLSVKDFGAVGDGRHDDTANIQAAIDSGAKTVYMPKGIYKITSTIHFGSSTASYKSSRFYGDGSNEDGTDVTRGSTFLWAGAANGTVVEITSAVYGVFEHFSVDGGGVASIGLLVDAKNSGGGSNQFNIFNNISISAVPGTIGAALYISGNQFSVPNQDVCRSEYRNIIVGPGWASGAPSLVKIGILQDGEQTVSNKFYNVSLNGYTSRGVDIEDGDAIFYGANFIGATTGANLDDVYVSPNAYWVNFHDSYHEINSSNNAATRHAYNFPAGSRSYSTNLDGVRVLWGLTSGNPLYYKQTGPITINGGSWDSAPSGMSTIYIDNAGTSSAIATLQGVHIASYINYFVTGNYVVPSSVTDRSRRDYFEPFLCGRLDSANIGQYGWNLRDIAGTTTYGCAEDGWQLQGGKIVTGGTAGNGGTLILDGASGKGIFSIDNAQTIINGQATTDSSFKFSFLTAGTPDSRVGYMTAGTGAAVPTAGLYLRYAPSLGDTTFWICMPTAGTETATCFDTGVSGDASIHTLRIRNITSGMVGVSLYSASGTITPIGLVGAGGPFNEAAICAFGCNYALTPNTSSDVTPAMSVINQSGAAATGYLYEWRASLAGLSQ